MEFFVPAVQGKLLLSTQSISGRSVKRPVEHHRICPEIVVCGLAFDLFAHDNTITGTGLPLLFYGSLRLWDLIQLRVHELVLLPTGRERPHYGTISIRFGKRGRNESVAVRPYFLRILLEILVKAARLLD